MAPLVTLLVTLLVTMFLTALTSTGGPATAAAASAAALSGLDDASPTPTTLNDFFPAERDISDCLSVLPKPGCGSEARGGWAQTAVFGAIMLGLTVIGIRIVIGLRRRDAVTVDD